jgi:hypothetical protein
VFKYYSRCYSRWSCYLVLAEIGLLVGLGFSKYRAMESNFLILIGLLRDNMNFESSSEFYLC